MMGIKRRISQTVEWVASTPLHIRYHAGVAFGLSPAQLSALLPGWAAPRVYWCDLEKLTFQVHLSDTDERSSGRLCLPGDWDGRAEPRISVFEVAPARSFREITHNTVRQIFVEGVEYSMTPEYRHLVELSSAAERRTVNKGGQRLGIDAYFGQMRQTFASIESRDYRTQQELGRRAGHHEVTLHVTRHGSLAHRRHGHHRIRMAEILGVRWVPCVITRVHHEWMTKTSVTSSQPPHYIARHFPEYLDGVAYAPPTGTIQR